MRSNSAPDCRTNARLARIGAALAIAQIAAAIAIGVAVARGPGLAPIDYSRMTGPHSEGGEVAIPVARYEAAARPSAR